MKLRIAKKILKHETLHLRAVARMCRGMTALEEGRDEDSPEAVGWDYDPWGADRAWAHVYYRRTQVDVAARTVRGRVRLWQALCRDLFGANPRVEATRLEVLWVEYQTALRAHAKAERELSEAERRNEARQARWAALTPIAIADFATTHETWALSRR